MKHPGVEHWKKLKRLLYFMNQIIYDKRIIRTNNLQEIQTYFDSSYAAHMDIRGHTGGVSTFGIGVLTANLSKHKMN